MSIVFLILALKIIFRLDFICSLWWWCILIVHFGPENKKRLKIRCLNWKDHYQGIQIGCTEYNYPILDNFKINPTDEQIDFFLEVGQNNFGNKIPDIAVKNYIPSTYFSWADIFSSKSQDHYWYRTSRISSTSSTSVLVLKITELEFSMVKPPLPINWPEKHKKVVNAI